MVLLSHNRKTEKEPFVLDPQVPNDLTREAPVRVQVEIIVVQGMGGKVKKWLVSLTIYVHEFASKGENKE